MTQIRVINSTQPDIQNKIDFRQKYFLSKKLRPVEDPKQNDHFSFRILTILDQNDQNQDKVKQSDNNSNLDNNIKLNITDKTYAKTTANTTANIVDGISTARLIVGGVCGGGFGSANANSDFGATGTVLSNPAIFTSQGLTATPLTAPASFVTVTVLGAGPMTAGDLKVVLEYINI